MIYETPQVRREKGWLADHLPSVLVDEPSDDFAFRSLVQVFEDVWETLLVRVENFPYQVDPRTSSPQMTKWIASWVGSTPELMLPAGPQHPIDDDFLGATAWRLAGLHHRRGTSAWYCEMLGFFVSAPGEPLQNRSGIEVADERLDLADGNAIWVKLPIRREQPLNERLEPPPAGENIELVDQDAVRAFLRHERPVGYPVYIQFGDQQAELLT